MILVDRRKGSAELDRHFRGRVLTDVVELPYGDFAFNSHPDDCFMVGIERKTIGDLIDSFRSGRLADHQLSGMAEMYKYSFIVVEGIIRRSENGLLERLVGREWTAMRCMWDEVQNRLLSFKLFRGVQVEFTSSERGTVDTVIRLYKYFTGKRLDQHHSHEGLQDHSVSNVFSLNPNYKPTLCRQMAALLPGVGNELSKHVAREFGSTYEMINAPEDSWYEIEGIGKKKAKNIYDAIRSKK